MTRDQARQEIRERWREIIRTMTEPAKVNVNGEQSYICPICGHGTGGDGLTRNPRSQDGNGLKCFGCDFSGDILDLVQKIQGTDYSGALTYCAGELHLDIEGQPKNDPTERARMEFSRVTNTKPHQESKSPQNATSSPTEAEADYRSYFWECMGRVNDPAAATYLKARGITEETVEKYGIGFDPAADPARAGHPTPRIIIPVTQGHYVARSTDPTTPKEYRVMNPKGATIGIFNEAILQRQDLETVFVTEGAFDALSIIEAGGQAIALNSTSNAKILIDHLAAHRTEATVILCLDQDKSGKKATVELQEGLDRLNISWTTADICGDQKDPNAALVADRESFIQAVDQAKTQNAARPDNVSDYISRIMSGEIETFREARDRKTGFTNLDKKAGGLFSGLYVIAAISSLGKTTLAHQIADNLAAAGEDVLFFSLEQSRLELVSKSLARITAKHDITTAVTSLDIRRGQLPKNVLQAAQEYQEAVGDRLSIIEGNFACDVSFIGDYTRRYIKRTGRRPVIFVDYLQIIQGEQDKRQTVRETVDTAVTELKRISREMNLTVFVISSVNRANYMTPIDFESLKESGGIEYSADVVWGLQLQCLNTALFDNPQAKIKEKRQTIREAKAADPRKIELLCLKNRYGISSFSVCFDYYPRHDLFIEGVAEDEFLGGPTRRK